MIGFGFAGPGLVGLTRRGQSLNMRPKRGASLSQPPPKSRVVCDRQRLVCSRARCIAATADVHDPPVPNRHKDSVSTSRLRTAHLPQINRTTRHLTAVRTSSRRIGRPAQFRTPRIRGVQRRVPGTEALRSLRITKILHCRNTSID